MNGARGEVSVVLAGEPRRLCLTLGALAEMETGLGVSGAAMGERLGRMSAGDLAVVLAALLRGGGEDGALASLVGLSEAAEAVAAAFEAAA